LAGAFGAIPRVSEGQIGRSLLITTTDADLEAERA
jgi:hypothetical protein